MASSLKQLIEEWRLRRDELTDTYGRPTPKSSTIDDCISDLRDTMIVMEAEEVRKHGN